MKWIGISGTWRTTDKKVEEDVRTTVREILDAGNGVVTGGATGVDFFATDEAMRCASDFSQIKVILPSVLEEYIGHLLAWSDGHDTGDPAVLQTDVERLIGQLRELQRTRSDSIIEGPLVKALDIRQSHYDARNTVVAELSDELVAFQVNMSTGTQNTIDKAYKMGKKVTLFSYAVQTDKAYSKIPIRQTSPK